MRFLVTGAWGQLGQALLEQGRRRGLDPIGIDLDDVDIRERDDVVKLVKEINPQWVFHCAARTDVDGCERDPDAVYRVNADGPVNVQAGAREAGARFLLVSTDFVFPGTSEEPYVETDPVNPLCVYGKSKEAGERRCLELWAEGTWVARTQWLYGPGGKHFVGAILRRARAEGRLKVVNDQIGCPTMTVDLAESMFDLALSSAAPGIYHASNEGQASWFDFARACLQIADLDQVQCDPIAAAELDLPAARPAWSVLSKEKLTRAIGRPMRHWGEALRDYLLERGGLKD